MSEELPKDLQQDLKQVSELDIVPSILDMACEVSGMRFAAIARVTDTHWMTCASDDRLGFGLEPGDQLDINATFCKEVKQFRKKVIFDDAPNDPVYKHHPLPTQYNIQSYASLPLIKSNGEFYGTFCVIDNIPNRVTEPKVIGTLELFADLIVKHIEAQEALKETRQKLAEEYQLGQLREQFIAILGHDLRDPLSSASLGVHALQTKMSDEGSQGLLKIVSSSLARAQGLVSDVLDLARGRLGGGLICDRKSVPSGEIRDFLQSILQESKALHTRAEIKQNFKVNQEVHCDLSRIGQVFSNLVNNALNHGDPNEPVEVLCESLGERGLRLVVSNKGDAIPKEVQAHLFQPFFRKNLSGHKDGLGLGLYISSEVAKAHGGKLEMSSTDELTKFELKF